jgi:hypothetical protein
LEMRSDLPGRQTTRRQRQHDLINARQSALSLLDDLRLKRRLGVPGDLDLDWADLRQHRLSARPVTAVAAVAPYRVMLLIAEVLAHLRVKRGLDDCGGAQHQCPHRRKALWEDLREAPRARQARVYRHSAAA